MGPPAKAGSHYGLPAAYRILLALSLALFLHSLLGAALALHLPQLQTPEPARVELTLVAAGDPHPTTSTASTPLRASRPSDPPEATPLARKEPVAGAGQPLAPTPQAQPEKAPRRQPDQQPAPSQSASAASEQRQQGRSSPFDGPDTARTSQLATKSSKQEPDYRQALARRISAQMGQQRVRLPGAPAREALKPVELELELMGNGALVNARVIRSSGFVDLDRSALRAALRASPYPEPPASQRSGALRYRIEFHLESAPPG
ncbi:MAG: TonB family protein [Marinobacter sp.]|uniref:energy transducer TonB family protein n=1 Tax=Marinobacter sp. TaxID=50741 RepID=UPI00299D258A|nr:TonB family protein [Marinobacter sp.]MDX1633538.1 TonB family protein [Marinobacter sp.]